MALYSSWSADGTQLAFISADMHQPAELRVLARATATERVVAHDVFVGPVAWSPDGLRIAFSGQSDPPRVFIINADGSSEKALTDTEGGAFVPSWSPDGRRLAFGSNRSGAWQVYTIDADGGGLTQLTHAKRRTGQPAGSWSPAWSPSGDRIAFLSNRTGNDEVFVMRTDGSAQTNLTDNPSLRSGDLAWSPDARQISFSARGQTATDDSLTEAYGIASILLQAGLVAGVVLLIGRQWPLPFGSLTLVFTLNAVLLSFMNDTFSLIPAAAIGGVAIDVALRRWRRPAPAPDAPSRSVRPLPAR